ncbi:MAG: phosphatase PAP2 family protein, partial [Lachnospiraceae bacterium]|nr:phosphatase PAP2 family protein [Lachnospiraceae bacterium]
MEFLYFLEGLRTPFGDAFFSLITHLGEETLFIVAGLIVFWCIDKLQGYYLLIVGLTGTVINQFLKLWFRIPRPWVKDPEFTIVESARAEATGYSFPSGHTQSSVGIFGAVARWNKNMVVRVVCVVICVLVPLSRMYLGVHTPADVGVSIAVA